MIVVKRSDPRLIAIKEALYDSLPDVSAGQINSAAILALMAVMRVEEKDSKCST